MRLFNVLPNFSFTTSEMTCDYYLKRWYIRVASPVKDSNKIRDLSTIKASQDNDLPVKILKENTDYFAEFICFIYLFNDSVNSSKFPSSFKCAIHHYHFQK